MATLAHQPTVYSTTRSRYGPSVTRAGSDQNRPWIGFVNESAAVTTAGTTTATTTLGVIRSS